MKLHYILIKETLEKIVAVRENNPDIATDIARSMYKKSEIILCADDHTETEIFCINGEAAELPI